MFAWDFTRVTKVHNEGYLWNKTKSQPTNYAYDLVSKGAAATSNLWQNITNL